MAWFVAGVYLIALGWFVVLAVRDWKKPTFDSLSALMSASGIIIATYALYRSVRMEFKSKDQEVVDLLHQVLDRLPKETDKLPE